MEEIPQLPLDEEREIIFGLGYTEEQYVRLDNVQRRAVAHFEIPPGTPVTIETPIEVEAAPVTVEAEEVEAEVPVEEEVAEEVEIEPEVEEPTIATKLGIEELTPEDIAKMVKKKGKPTVAVKPPEEEPEVTPVVEAPLTEEVADKTAIALVHPRRDPKGENFEMVTLDVADVDALWKLDEQGYFAPGEGTKDRQEIIIREMKEGQELSAPIVDFMKIPEDWDTPHAGKIRLSFTDGRNRFAVLRDSGAKKIKMVIPKDAEERALLEEALEQLLVERRAKEYEKPAVEPTGAEAAVEKRAQDLKKLFKPLMDIGAFDVDVEDFAFDNEIYKKSLPIFKDTLGETLAAGETIEDFIGALDKVLGEQYTNAEPYITRFIEDIQAGKVKITEEGAT